MIGLPLKVRLRRALLVALIMGLWAPCKILWEQKIGAEQNLLRYGGIKMTRQLRDDLGQGLTIGVLSGMRNVVADLIWLEVTGAWQVREWFRMGALINLCTALQPRYPTFWDMGGWQLAYNASVDAQDDVKEPNPLKRLKASQFWIQKGLEVYQRGIENNPEDWRLLADTAGVYQQRLADNEMRRGEREAAAKHYRMAASYFEQAILRPKCPTYFERFPAYMYQDAGDDEAAYKSWVDLWNRLTPQQRELKEHAQDKIKSSIQQLEQKLSIPKEKRIFPN